MGRGEFLQAGHSPESRHRLLTSSKRKMRVFSPIIEMPTDFLALDIPNLFHSCAKRSEAISHDRPKFAAALLHFLEKPQCRCFIKGFSDLAVKQFALVVHGHQRPCILPFIFTNTASRCHCHCVTQQVACSPQPDFAGKQRAETDYQCPRALVADIDAGLMQEAFNKARRERKPDMEHNRKLDDLRQCLDVAERF